MRVGGSAEQHVMRGVALAAGLLVFIAGAIPASAELRSLEVVGVEPLVEGARRSGIPRQLAVDQALWEGVSRVALDLMAEYGPPIPPDGSDPGTVPPDGDPSEKPGSSPTDDSGDGWLREALGEDMTPFARSFRIVEDQGVRPALFSTQTGAASEYVVVVDVKVDVDRVRERLQSRGLIFVEAESNSGEGLEIEISGLEVWAAYQTFLKLVLTPDVGGQDVRPIEFERGRTLMWLGVSGSPEQVLERLLAAAPPSLQITPLDVATASPASGLGRALSLGIGSSPRAPRLKLAVRWTPPPLEPVVSPAKR